MNAEAMEAKAEYEAFARRLEEIERATGAYLHDPMIDGENAADHDEGTKVYWWAMIASAQDAAYYRAQEAGFDINDYFDHPIF